MPSENDPLFSRIEAAEYIGVSKLTLDDWATSGRNALPFFKVGKLAKYRKSDLDCWLASRVATSAAGHRAALATA